MNESKRALFLWGGMEFHDPENTSLRFARALESRGYVVQITNDLTVLEDRTALELNDLIVICITMGEISDIQEQNLTHAVRSGTGLGGWHGGLGDTFRTRTDYHYMVGGQWVKHPGDIRSYSVQVSTNHEITDGVQDFPVHSEQYYMHVDPAVNVLATTTFDGNDDSWIAGAKVPVAWTKQYGQGKVFYCSIGHTDADFHQPDSALLVEQGLVWATR